MITFDKLARHCSSRVKVGGEPHGELIGGKRWAFATDGHYAVVVRTRRSTLPATGSRLFAESIEKTLLEKPRRVRVGRLVASCRRIAQGQRYIPGDTVARTRSIRIGESDFNPVILARSLSDLPRSLVVELRTGGEREPMVISGRDWMVVQMPLNPLNGWLGVSFEGWERIEEGKRVRG